MSEEFSFAQWVGDGVQGVRDKLRWSGGGLLPEAYRQHMSASRKEFLLALRSLFETPTIDGLAQTIEKMIQGGAESRMATISSIPRRAHRGKRS